MVNSAVINCLQLLYCILYNINQLNYWISFFSLLISVIVFLINCSSELFFLYNSNSASFCLNFALLMLFNCI